MFFSNRWKTIVHWYSLVFVTIAGIALENSLRKHAQVLKIFSSRTRSKIDYFYRKNFDIFLIFAQNIDCGYTLEPF